MYTCKMHGLLHSLVMFHGRNFIFPKYSLLTHSNLKNRKMSYKIPACNDFPKVFRWNLLLRYYDSKEYVILYKIRIQKYPICLVRLTLKMSSKSCIYNKVQVYKKNSHKIDFFFIKQQIQQPLILVERNSAGSKALNKNKILRTSSFIKFKCKSKAEAYARLLLSNRQKYYGSLFYITHFPLTYKLQNINIKKFLKGLALHIYNLLQTTGGLKKHLFSLVLTKIL